MFCSKQNQRQTSSLYFRKHCLQAAKQSTSSLLWFSSSSPHSLHKHSEEERNNLQSAHPPRLALPQGNCCSGGLFHRLIQVGGTSGGPSSPTSLLRLGLIGANCPGSCKPNTATYAKNEVLRIYLSIKNAGRHHP